MHLIYLVNTESKNNEDFNKIEDYFTSHENLSENESKSAINKFPSSKTFNNMD